MITLLKVGLVGAGVVWAAKNGGDWVAPKLPASLMPYAPHLIGAVALIAVHKFAPSAT